LHAKQHGSLDELKMNVSTRYAPIRLRLHPVPQCVYNLHTPRHTANLHLSNRTLIQFYTYRYWHLTSSTSTLHRFKISGVKLSALVAECHTTQRSQLAVALYNESQGTWIPNSKHFRCTNILSVFYL